MGVASVAGVSLSLASLSLVSMFSSLVSARRAWRSSALTSRVSSPISSAMAAFVPPSCLSSASALPAARVASSRVSSAEKTFAKVFCRALSLRWLSSVAARARWRAVRLFECLAVGVIAIPFDFWSAAECDVQAAGAQPAGGVDLPTTVVVDVVVVDDSRDRLAEADSELVGVFPA